MSSLATEITSLVARHMGKVRDKLQDAGVSKKIIDSCIESTSSTDKYPQDYSDGKVVVIENYGAKSHALFGDFGKTYSSFKDKHLKGDKNYSYNQNLRFGPGWILMNKEGIGELCKALKKAKIKFQRIENDDYVASLQKDSKTKKSSDSDDESGDDSDVDDKRKKIESDDSDDSDDEGDKKSKNKSKNKSKKKSKDDDSDEDSDSEDEDDKKSKNKPKDDDSDDDSDDESDKKSNKKKKSKDDDNDSDDDSDDEDDKKSNKKKKSKDDDSDDEDDKKTKKKGKKSKDDDSDDEDDKKTKKKGKKSKDDEDSKKKDEKPVKNKFGNYVEKSTGFVFLKLPVGKNGKETRVVIGIQDDDSKKKGTKSVIALDKVTTKEATSKGYKTLTVDMLESIDKKMKKELSHLSPKEEDDSGDDSDSESGSDSGDESD